jgi:hypothetical protein
LRIVNFCHSQALGSDGSRKNPFREFESRGNSSGMAQPQSHFFTSVLCSLVLSAFGLFVLHISPELIILGGILMLGSALLPNIDSGHNGIGREFSGFIAAIAPWILIQYIPELRGGSLARFVIIFCVAYAGTKYLLDVVLNEYFTPRGVMHSLPAAILIGEITYLIFRDVEWNQRLYLASASTIGYLSHLVLDATGNIDLRGAKQRRPAALKFFGTDWKSTAAMYTTVLGLGWFVMKDLYPHFKLYAGISY